MLSHRLSVNIYQATSFEFVFKIIPQIYLDWHMSSYHVNQNSFHCTPHSSCIHLFSFFLILGFWVVGAEPVLFIPSVQWLTLFNNASSEWHRRSIFSNMYFKARYGFRKGSIQPFWMPLKINTVHNICWKMVYLSCMQKNTRMTAIQTLQMLLVVENQRNKINFVWIVGTLTSPLLLLKLSNKMTLLLSCWAFFPYCLFRLFVF